MQVLISDLLQAVVLWHAALFKAGNFVLLSNFVRLLSPKDEKNKTRWRRFSTFHEFTKKISEQAPTYENDLLCTPVFDLQE